MPFRVQEVYDKNGIYYGQNVISKNMMIADRRKLLNGNSFILGVSGAGKSFAGKNEITNLMWWWINHSPLICRKHAT